jgi:hypothetical protein
METKYSQQYFEAQEKQVGQAEVMEAMHIILIMTCGSSPVIKPHTVRVYQDR